MFKRRRFPVEIILVCALVLQVRISYRVDAESENRSAPFRSSLHIWSRYLPGGALCSYRTPLLESRVQSGWATMRESQPSFRISRTSHCI